MRKGEKEKRRKGEREKGRKEKGVGVAEMGSFCGFAIFRHFFQIHSFILLFHLFNVIHVGEFCPSPNGLISGCGGSPRRLGKKKKRKRQESHEEKGKGD